MALTNEEKLTQAKNELSAVETDQYRLSLRPSQANPTHLESLEEDRKAIEKEIARLEKAD